MNHNNHSHLVHRPPDDHTKLTPGDDYDYRPTASEIWHPSPTHQEQVRAILVRSAAPASDIEGHYADRRQLKLTDPGVVIATVMLGLVTIVAVVAIVSVVLMAAPT